MRYDTKVLFWNAGTGKYNPVTHTHDNHRKLVFTAYANVTDLGLDKQVELLGGIKEGSKTIRLAHEPEHNGEWDYMTINSHASPKYRFVSSLNVLKGYAMVVGKDNG